VLGLGASTAIRWMERWATTGSVAALPGTGHSRSPLEVHRQWLLDLIAAEPDLTLEEIRARLKSEKRLKTGTTSVWRFYERHDITFKENSARRRTGSSFPPPLRTFRPNVRLRRSVRWSASTPRSGWCERAGCGRPGKDGP
jgi:transposase